MNVWRSKCSVCLHLNRYCVNTKRSDNLLGVTFSFTEILRHNYSGKEFIRSIFSSG
jgi:hypothetical protein